jgi:hypothetical protein
MSMSQRYSSTVASTGCHYRHDSCFRLLLAVGSDEILTQLILARRATVTVVVVINPCGLGSAS